MSGGQGPEPTQNRRGAFAPRVMLAGVDFDMVDFDGALDIIVRLASDGRRHHVVTANVDHVMLLRRNERFRRAYEFASLRVADGAPIVLLSKLVGRPLPVRVTGSDLFELVCERAQSEGLSVGFLGGRPDAVPIALDKLRLQFPELRIAGAHCPPYGFDTDAAQSAEAVAAVDEMQPDLLFVLLGAPKQETWFQDHAQSMPPLAALHFGASLDFYAGIVQRAPSVWRRFGLEWLYRLVKEPRRMWRRYLVRDVGFFRILVFETLRARVYPRRPPEMRLPATDPST